MKKLEIFGEGLFVRKDTDGRDCFVGDFVKVTRPAFKFENTNERIIDVEKQTWGGRIHLLKSKGVVIKYGKEYIKAPLTDHSKNKWIWEKADNVDYSGFQ